MKRRQFVKSGFILIAAFAAGSKLAILNAAERTADLAQDYKTKILGIIKSLKKEGSSLVAKVMNGRKYEFDPYTHYPNDGGIKDKTTGFQLFFHAHREDEYGHFHTFATDENNELIHLILISMNAQGELIGLATVNRWVTGDKYVKADRLKELIKSFHINPDLYKDKRVIEFVNYIFKAYKTEIEKLFDQRDEWIMKYAKTYYKEPFEDRDYEILSSKKIFLKAGKL
ncbi:MAG: hypothetical protein K9J16_14255 [Melioribacteraceae bacterium]|nr:hypothetical protein [Melioribacteraceae bacterium]MCF8355869.1 hypothetical protein [Melioribacteraceae bacterium]MCF8393289.1 hypothetical protein [Melioribacteraceae bacterium]MCF8419141.1 hypothetical protein [Melioribacteraceae bacterium]